MAEKFRRIKREENKFFKNISRSRWSRMFFVGLLFAVLIYLVSFLLYGKNKSVSEKQDIEDKNLSAAVCRLGNCFWLNKEGWAYNQSGRLDGNIVLKVEDKTDRNLAVGEKLLDSNTLAELIFLRSKVLDDLDVGLKEGETADLNSGDFDFTTSEGWKLRLSVNENVYKTLETLKQSLTEIKKTAPTAGLEYVDLRVPNKVYYKFR